MHHHFEAESMSLEVRRAYDVCMLLAAYFAILLLLWMLSV
jgi:hypothetical protein